MFKKLRAETVTLLAYLSFLVGFVALGLFVYALTADGSLTGVFGIAVIAAFAAAVVLFPMGARMRAKVNDSGIDIPGINIFATPLKRDQIDAYLTHYRGAPETDDAPEPVLAQSERRAA
ncbi:hypothetical protein [Mycobacterium sp. GA-2829]|uniref:hypothetical protein n=1 Tax=Mycobacterium sp. GA-2829 TaxID=1772283 RepID=UPI0007401093|nr:hypothetical protein [Mycobacterium sp. GA-2829]KUI39249.1 hypothetical protein AU194_14560 [Mycobacterium sp. GA-2829]